MINPDQRMVSSQATSCEFIKSEVPVLHRVLTLEIRNYT